MRFYFTQIVFSSRNGIIDSLSQHNKFNHDNEFKNVICCSMHWLECNLVYCQLFLERIELLKRTCIAIPLHAKKKTNKCHEYLWHTVFAQYNVLQCIGTQQITSFKLKLLTQINFILVPTNHHPLFCSKWCFEEWFSVSITNKIIFHLIRFVVFDSITAERPSTVCKDNWPSNDYKDNNINYNCKFN